MKQRFDPFVWNEVTTNEKIPHSKGNLRLRLSQPAPLYIEAEGVEALAGYSADFDLEISEAVTFRVEAPKQVRAFLYAALSTSVEAQGEVFTNIDRKPYESGMMAEVSKARRMLELEKRSMLAEIRREASIQRNTMKAKATGSEALAEGQGEAETEKQTEEAKADDVPKPSA